MGTPYPTVPAISNFGAKGALCVHTNGQFHDFSGGACEHGYNALQAAVTTNPRGGEGVNDPANRKSGLALSAASSGLGREPNPSSWDFNPTGDNLGLGLVEALVDRGARVTVVARDKDALASVRQRLGVAVQPADVTDEGAAHRILAEVRPDILVLNAGAMFARAFVALDELAEAPALRPWLFRIAHNRALDLMRSRTIRAAEPIEAADEVADPESPDPVEALMRREAVETAVSRFVELPTMQRSIVILKDVLDQPLGEIAALLDLTVNAVKAHLARGGPGSRPSTPRRRLKLRRARRHRRSPATLCCSTSATGELTRHAGRRRPADPVVLPAARRPRRSGDVLQHLCASAPGRESEWRGRTGARRSRSGRYLGGEAQHFMWLEWTDGRISFIRDYRHVPYVVDDAELILASDGAPPVEGKPNLLDRFRTLSRGSSRAIQRRQST